MNSQGPPSRVFSTRAPAMLVLSALVLVCLLLVQSVGAQIPTGPPRPLPVRGQAQGTPQDTPSYTAVPGTGTPIPTRTPTRTPRNTATGTRSPIPSPTCLAGGSLVPSPNLGSGDNS